MVLAVVYSSLLFFLYHEDTDGHDEDAYDKSKNHTMAITVGMRGWKEFIDTDIDHDPCAERKKK